MYTFVFKSSKIAKLWKTKYDNKQQYKREGEYVNKRTNRVRSRFTPVSYTHLDVYKRQV